jgi:hypothetical protein
MAVFNSNVLAGASGQTSGAAAGEYQIDRSLRFERADDAYLSRTFSAGNRKTWTFSCWAKLSEIGTNRELFCVPGANPWITLQIANNNKFYVSWTAGTSGTPWQSDALFRDPSAWYHFVVAWDTTQSTDSNRLKVYANGVQLTGSSSYPNHNTDYQVNSAVEHGIGGNKDELGGYLADVHFVDGEALAPTDFGRYDSNNLWVPKAYSGTYGTNGFHLDFSDNSSNAALGTDSSGNSNTWTVNNLAAVVDEISASTSEISNPNNSVANHLNIFDGDTSTTVSSGNGGRVIWTPSSNISISKIEGYFDDSLNGYRITMSVSGGSSQTITIDTSSGGTANQWNEFTSLSGDTIGPSNAITFSMLRPAGNDTDPGLHDLNALRINDKLVVLNSSEAGVDSLIDTPTNYTVDSGNPGGNYCTWNSAALVSNGSSNSTFSNGNLEGTTSSSNVSGALGTIGVSSGKWYYEITCGAFTGGTGLEIGASQEDLQNTISASQGPGDCPNGYFYINDGRKVNNSSASSYGATYTDGDVIGVALDLDNSTIEFFKNGSSQGDAYTSMNAGTYFPAVGDYNNSGGASFTANFGQRAFAYSVPSGYKALCTTNLDDPTITDPSTVFDTTLYSGNDTQRDITGLDFSPDMVWIKKRSDSGNHSLMDTVRGATENLVPNDTQSEGTETGYLNAFLSNGFSIGTSGVVNDGSSTYVAWAWDGGGSTASNTDGSISSSVRANQDAGFSIVTYTGTGSNATVGHGLNAKPDFYVCKGRSVSDQWMSYHSSLGATQFLEFTTGGTSAGSNRWNDTEPTSSVFSLGTEQAINKSGDTFVAYCWNSVDQYSAFGSYEGNGSDDGPFVYTGFKPRWILIKNVDNYGSGYEWFMFDTARDTYNVAENILNLDTNGAETDSDSLDILSNGFKIRATTNGINLNSHTHIYLAFAEQPFKTSRAA